MKEDFKASPTLIDELQAIVKNQFFLVDVSQIALPPSGECIEKTLPLACSSTFSSRLGCSFVERCARRGLGENLIASLLRELREYGSMKKRFPILFGGPRICHIVVVKLWKTRSLRSGAKMLDLPQLG